MNERLLDALSAIRELNAETALSPVAFADKREAALIEGLHGLAQEYGRAINPTRIDRNGEMSFNIIGDHGPGNGRPSGLFGEDLARWLSMVPRRFGDRPTTAPVLPENGWCRINHFDVERLLRAVGEHILDPQHGKKTPGMN